MSELQVESVSIDSLMEDPDNTRKHNERNIEAISTSLATFGQRRPLVVWQDTVIAGNGTLRAAKNLGWSEISIARVPNEWSHNEARAYAIADNRTAELAEWDNELLVYALDELKAADLFNVTGFTEDEMKDLEVPLLDGVEDAGEILAIADVSVKEPNYKVNYGEVWELSIPDSYRTHILVVVNPIQDWGSFINFLQADSLLLLYPDPYITHTNAAKKQNFVLVQSDEYLAGHLLDKHSAIFGADSVKLQA